MILLTTMLIIQGNDIIDVSELASDISYSTSLMGYAGKLTFNMRKDDSLGLQNGDNVAFIYEGENIFLGRIFTININSTGDYSVVAYDQLRYFQNHDSVYTDGTETAADIFTKICKSNNLKFTIKNIPVTRIKAYYFNDQSYFDIMNYCIDETHRANVVFNYFPESVMAGATVEFSGGANYLEPTNTDPTSTSRLPGTATVTAVREGAAHPYHIIGISSNVYGWVNAADVTLIPGIKFNPQEHYFIRDNFGTVEFLSLTETLKTFDTKKQENTIMIGDGSLVTNYEYSLDIDKNTFNEVIAVSETKKQDSKGVESDNIRYADRRPTIQQWGTLRKIVNVQDGAKKEEIADIVRLMLDVYNKPTKTLRLSCLGENGLYAGNAFFLSLADLGIACYVYILSATHHYDGDIHTMELQVTTDGNFPEGL